MAVTAALLWITTFGCLVCCFASCTPGEAPSPAAAPSCCAPHEPACAAGETAGGDEMGSCDAHVCPMMANAPGPALAAGSSQDQALLPLAVVPPAGRAAAAPTPPPGARSFAANRGDTHLRCCVFLI